MWDWKSIGMTRCLLSFILIVFAVNSNAATQNAASTSLADFTTAYNACSDGDILQMPAGNSTWASKATITKAIEIIGAGTNLTILSGASGIFKFEPTSDKSFRVHNIAFTQPSYGSSYANGPVVIETLDQSTNRPLYCWRVDHCRFFNAYSAVGVKGINAWGVIDQNLFVNCDIAVQPLGGSLIYLYPIQSGITAGTNALYIENNKFRQTATILGVNEQITSGQGVRIVLRYSDFFFTDTGSEPLPYEQHGGAGGSATAGTPPASDVLRGPLCVEIYMNTMVGTSGTYRYMNLRGGSILCWSNAMSGGTGAITLTEDDSSAGHEATWPSLDQINNSHFWGNTIEGSAFTAADFDYQDGNDATLIQENRDFFMHAPDATSGKTTWSDWTGSHQATFTGGVANHHYPYTPLAYPHPLVTAQDGGGGAPTAPSSLSATAISSSQINLTWTDNASDEDGFEVSRALDSGFSSSPVTTGGIAANATSYNSTGLSAVTTYYYRVRATNAFGASSYSASANSTTTADPSGPGNTGNRILRIRAKR